MYLLNRFRQIRHAKRSINNYLSNECRYHFFVCLDTRKRIALRLCNGQWPWCSVQDVGWREKSCENRYRSAARYIDQPSDAGAGTLQQLHADEHHTLSERPARPSDGLTQGRRSVAPYIAALVLGR